MLHLSGPHLKNHFELLVAGSEHLGGVERYVEALMLRTGVFKDILLNNDPATIDYMTLRDLCSLVPPVRRRIGPYLEDPGLSQLRDGLVDLLNGMDDTSTTDLRIKGFCERFPQDKKHRWVRDFATEVLHGTNPERYPLMCRWVWDQNSNSGVIREIWFEQVDHSRLDVPDGYETFLVLREELSQFLNDNGVFRDMIWYLDLLTAQAYASYICSQGGTYLRADFSSPEDPMEHVRRLLGLDGAKVRFGQSHRRPVSGEVVEVGQIKMIQ